MDSVWHYAWICIHLCLQEFGKPFYPAINNYLMVLDKSVEAYDRQPCKSLDMRSFLTLTASAGCSRRAFFLDDVAAGIATLASSQSKASRNR